jgi:Holliday junction resolvase RusA-like endonuclease
MKIYFTLYEKPMGYKRLVSNRRTIISEKYFAYCDRVSAAFFEYDLRNKFDLAFIKHNRKMVVKIRLTRPVIITVKSYFFPPKTLGGKRLSLQSRIGLAGSFACCKPDADNIWKAIVDSIVYEDSYCQCGGSYKHYIDPMSGDRERVEVEIKVV